MATAPSISPFFPAPYTPPAPESPSYHYAAAYPPPLPGFVTAPAYAFPPSFPYSYHYPHPAAAYAHPPGFFPTPAYPYAATYPHPPDPIHLPYSQLHAPSATQSPPSASATNLPPPAANNFSSVAPLLVLPDHESSSPAHHISFDHSTVQEAPQPDTVHPAPNREHRPSHSHASSTSSGKSGGACHPALPNITCLGRDLTKRNSTSSSETFSMVNTSYNHRFFMEKEAAVQAVADECVPAKDANPKVDSALLELHHPDAPSSTGDRKTDASKRHATAAAFPTSTATPTTPSALLFPGTPLSTELAKLTAMVSQLSDSIGKLVASRHTSKLAASTPAPARVVSQVFDESPTPSSCKGTGIISPASSASSTALVVPQAFAELPTPNSCNGTGSTSPASSTPSTDVVVPQLFGEMPRPRYCPRKYSSPLHYYEEQETPALSPFVSEGNNNLSEQNIHGMPQSYGFNNLNRQSIILADGTEHSYYALPENYPLERATPEPLPSNKSVVVLADTPRQQLYDEKQEESEKIHKCFNKALETEETSACLSYISAVCDCTFEQQQQNGETAPVNVQQLRAPRLNLLEIDESIGMLASTPKQQPHDEGLLADVQDFSLELQPQDEVRTLKCPIFQASDSYVTRYNQLSTVHRELRLLWDPGASTPLHSSKPKPREELSYVAIVISKVGTYGKQLRDPIWNVLVLPEERKEWDPGDTTFHVLFTTADDATKLMCTNVYRSARLQILAVKFGARRALVFESAVMGYLASDLRWTAVNAIILFVLAVTCSTGKAKLQWDPGIVSSSSRFIWLVSDKHRGQTGKALVWLQSQLFSVLQLQMSKTSPVWDQSILSLMHMMWGKTAVQTRVHISHTSFQLFDFIEQLVNLKHSRSELLLQCNSWCYIPNAFLQVAQEEREEAAHITQANYICSLYCNSVLKMSCVWDPGVNKSLYDWLTILTGWSATDKQFPCTHITAAAIEPNQLVGNTLLLQFLFTRRKDMVTKGTTTSPNGSQQNCNTNNLLPSQNYLQFVELGIIFITFLPP